MNKYKAVFCDIDGTLITDEKELTPEVKASVKKLVDSGVPFILVSGRMPAGIYPIQEKLSIEGPIVSFHGGLVIDEEGKTLFEKGIDFESACQVEECAENSGVSAALNFYHNRNWYTNNLSHPMERWEADSIGFDPVETHVKEVTGEGDVINKCMFAGYEEEIEELEKILAKAFPELKVVCSLPVLLEVFNKDVKKSDGIKILCDSMGIGLNEVIAIGDNFNDLDMLQEAGLAVLMDNAPELLKESLPKAYIAPSNNESGVSSAIEDLFFSK